MAYQPRMDDFSQVPQAPPATLLFSTYHAIGNVAGRTDAQGNEFIAVQFNFARSNDSVIYVRKYSPTGQMLAHKTFPHYNYDKHDALALYSAGRNLIILHGGHDTPNPVPPEGRENPVGRSVWEDIYEPFPPGMEPEGGVNSWVGGPDPEQEPNVTIDEIREVVRYEVERGNGRLADEFDENGIAAGLRSRPAEGMAYIMDPANHHDETAARWQDALFGFVKNANAGVQANILGGQDEWGQARREELKDIIREVLAETSMLAELDTTEEEPS